MSSTGRLGPANGALTDLSFFTSSALYSAGDWLPPAKLMERIWPGLLRVGQTEALWRPRSGPQWYCVGQLKTTQVALLPGATQGISASSMAGAFGAFISRFLLSS